MHRSYRFDISSHITGEPVELEVDLASATEYAEAERRRLGDRPSAYPNAPFNFIRKMACSFGWAGGLISVPPASGSRCGWSVGPLFGWLRWCR
jgi:beta-mannosidase